LGAGYNKSLTSIFPKVPAKYLPDYIRGLWDGDGCIYFNNHQKSFQSVFVSGSRIFIKKLLLCLKNNIVGFRGEKSL